MAAPKGGSRNRLLDSAEKLFSEKGYEGTSTREIASHAGDTLGTLSYHFGNKDALFMEVVRRRFNELMNMRREKYLEIVQDYKGANPNIEDTLRAIVVPFIHQAMCGGPTWESYISLLGRIMYIQTERHAEFIADLADPIGAEMMGWLKKACPEADPTDIAYAYQFVIGCMLDSVAKSQKSRTARLSGRHSVPDDFEAVSSRVLRFVTAGTKDLLRQES